MTSYLYTFVNNSLQAEHSFISHHNSTTGDQLFSIVNICYSVTGELKGHNLCTAYLPFSLTQVWSRMRQWQNHDILYPTSVVNFIWFVNEKLFIYLFERMHSTTAPTHQQVFAKSISWAPGISLAVNSFQLQPVKCDVIITPSVAMNI